MTLTPTTTPTLTGLHLRLPTPASTPQFSPHLNKQSTGRSMLVQVLLNLHPEPTPSRRRNVRKLRTELQPSDIEKRRNPSKDMIDEELELLS